MKSFGCGGAERERLNVGPGEKPKNVRYAQLCSSVNFCFKVIKHSVMNHIIILNDND